MQFGWLGGTTFYNPENKCTTYLIRIPYLQIQKACGLSTCMCTKGLICCLQKKKIWIICRIYIYQKWAESGERISGGDSAYLCTSNQVKTPLQMTIFINIAI